MGMNEILESHQAAKAKVERHWLMRLFNWFFRNLLRP